MGVLLAEKPVAFDEKTIRGMLVRNRRQECFADAWSQPFIIDPVESETGGLTYRVTSLGSDGKRGLCCLGFVDSFKEDAVLEGDMWLQQWTFGHSPVP